MSLQDKIKNAKDTMWPLTIDDVELWAEQNNFIIVTDEWWENAQDIICKYQKIQEIIKDWEDGRFSDAVGCLRVKAVLDGNDD